MGGWKCSHALQAGLQAGARLLPSASPYENDTAAAWLLRGCCEGQADAISNPASDSPYRTRRPSLPTLPQNRLDSSATGRYANAVLQRNVCIRSMAGGGNAGEQRLMRAWKGERRDRRNAQKIPQENRPSAANWRNFQKGIPFQTVRGSREGNVWPALAGLSRAAAADARRCEAR